MAVKTYVVTVPAGIGGGYYLDGVQKPTLAFAKGATYRFDVSDATNLFHPLRFSTTSDGTHGGGSEYTTGVTVNGTQGNPGAYVEIDTTTASPDTLYYYCTAHSGMGGQVNLTADSYGANSWNLNSWGNQDENFVNLSGFSLSAQLENVIAYPSVGYGGQVWGNGEWGELGSPEVIPTGISLSATLDSVSITAEVNVGWSAKTWGYPDGGGWGNLFDVNQPLTGFGLTANQGEETVTDDINTGWSRNDGWGTYAWGIAGQVLAADFPITANLNSVTVDNEINIGWGSDTWGYETWGESGLNVSLTGVSASFDIGALGAEGNASTGELTGEAMTVTQGDEEAYINFTAELTGQPMTMTLQFEEIVINATGFGLTMQEGDETATPNTIAEVSSLSPVTWGNSAWGYGVYGNQPVTTLAMSMQEGDLDPAPDVSLTGNAAAMFLGEETVTADANTGTITPINWGEQAWGESTWGNGTYLSGASYSQAATISLGTAVGDANTIASITGQLMTMQEGDEGTTANARINVTGINLTFSVGTVYNLIWNEVNTGTTSIWSEVDTAA
jgi:hypothetical protein